MPKNLKPTSQATGDKKALHIHLHQTHHTLADFTQIFAYIRKHFENGKAQAGLHLFPELFLAGYPLQDLCLQRPFILSYHRFLEDLNTWSMNHFQSPSTSPVALLLGGLAYELDQAGLPIHIRNVIYLLQPGSSLELLYTKRLLPNYDIFDEKKYFTPGTRNKVWNWNGLSLALMICEDMWPSTSHPIDPTIELYEDLKNKKIQVLDLVINLSASPFNLNKESLRIDRGREISQVLDAPFVYVNRVGGEDEILFDGQSFVVHGNNVLHLGEAFKAQLISLPFPDAREAHKDYPSHSPYRPESPIPTNFPNSSNSPNTWENLFRPRLVFEHNIPSYQHPILQSWTDRECEIILKALIFGLQEYAQKCNFKDYLVAFSGGIDSALTLWIAHLSLRPGQNLEAVFMPSKYSSSLSYELVQQFCNHLKIPLFHFPIKFLHSVCQKSFQDNFNQGLQGLADENIQSRLRGTLLYARSNQTGAMVINTSNKSELSVGYSTLYGDSVGAIGPLGDLYKTEVYQLAQFLNRKFPGTIPAELLTRPPSAELRKDQEDAHSLPPYDRLDPILEGILSYRMDFDELVQHGFSPDEVKKVFHLYGHSEYKRRQFCPIIKISPKSFGFGYRVPITKNMSFYFNESSTHIQE